MYTALLCDDDRSILDLTQAVLEKEGIECIAFQNPQAVWDYAKNNPPPNVAIIDVEMPEASGYWLCKTLLGIEGYKSLPVIFMTSRSGPKDEVAAFEHGARDFICKPFSPATLIARTKTHINTEVTRRELERHQADLNTQVEEKTRELASLQSITIFALTSLCGERDHETGTHILRTQLYVLLLAKYLGEFRDIPKDALFRYSPLHDIGKIGIPDKILLKPGKLTPEEFEVIKTHTTIGHRAMLGAKARGSSRLPELDVACKIIRSHHEKWNGTGYPDGTAGEAIPLVARIMAVADVYDALRSRRPYKEPLPHKKTCEIIERDSGTHFDPEVVEAFRKTTKEFEEVSESHQTGPEELGRAKQRLMAHQEKKTT